MIGYYRQSSILRGIKLVMGQVDEGSRWLVGDVKSISVWRDKW